MTDNLTKEQRSFCMSKVKGKNTAPELILKDRIEGFQYQPKNIFGRPDFINWMDKIIIFVDGCFWHKCSRHFKEPKSNKNYWIPKIEKNVVRDREVDLIYRIAGWRIIRIWEHELKSPLLHMKINIKKGGEKEHEKRNYQKDISDC